MPELPEVEAARRQAERACLGRTIESVFAAEDRIVFAGVEPAMFASSLRGRDVLAVRRKGKQMWLELDRGPHPLFHFGMTGSFEVYTSEDDRPRFTKCELRMDDGTLLAMPDPRRLGRIRLLRDPEHEPPIALLGRDPLLDPIPPKWLREELARRRAPIKAVLLDQSVFAGVGNWIADEVLYQAGIAPQRLASSLTADEVRRLSTKLRTIIKRAADVDADYRRFPKAWLFHRRWSVRASRSADVLDAANRPIRFDTIAGRTTAWVPTAQR